MYMYLTLAHIVLPAVMRPAVNGTHTSATAMVETKDSSHQFECVDNEHSCEELAVLSVEFPPWYFSTHGLSRPATPNEQDLPRYEGY